MKIIFDDTNAMTISIEGVNPNKHVIAGTDSDGRIVLLRRAAYGGENFIGIVMTIESLQSGNSYLMQGRESFRDILSIDHIKWHAFYSMRDFFEWAAKETNE